MKIKNYITTPITLLPPFPSDFSFGSQSAPETDQYNCIRWSSYFENLETNVDGIYPVILGQICGTIIYMISKDNIGFAFLGEDDGHWAIKNSNGSSVYWVDDYLKVLKTTKKFLDDNFERHRHGYKIKSDSKAKTKNER